jgi:hypothetical protein
MRTATQTSLLFAGVLFISAVPPRLYAQNGALQSLATIDAIDPNTHIVTGHVNATGQSVEFKVANQLSRMQLHAGQRFYVNLSVSLDGRNPVGTLISLAAPPPASPGGGSNASGSQSTGNNSPSSPNAYLPAVQAAANLLTGSGNVVVRPQCNGLLVISCSGGKPVTSTIQLTRNSLNISPAGANAYTFSAQIAALTPADIPVSYSGVSCELSVNTGRAAPLSASGTFNVANLSVPNVYKLTLSGLRVSSAQGNIQFSGSVGCNVANALQGMAESSLLPQALESRSSNPVCVAVDPKAGAKAVNCPQ